MNIHTFAKSLRNLRNRVQIDVNRSLGRAYIPHHARKLCIETSSLCNLACRFCPYDKKASPRVTMADEFFFECVEQAVDMGFARFELTPCTGDVFMDKGILRKLAFLDEHPRVESYSFFTNFTIPSRIEIERVLQLSKLKSMKISVYGHDLESFLAITKSTEKVYRRFVTNLETLHGHLSQARFAMSFGLRTTGDGGIRGTSEVQRVLGRFQEQGIRVGMKRVFNNWGGSITPADVEGLDIEVTDTRSTYKKGACTLLFTGVQVMATGVVNGCACRDTEATLRIGDLHDAPLASILSLENPAYVQLVQEQEAGQFRPVCQGCDFYKSIYRTTSAARKRGRSSRKIEEYLVTPTTATANA
jgi:sulfatase maturation enzyme AslB (radical SAM superfamily)